MTYAVKGAGFASSWNDLQGITGAQQIPQNVQQLLKKAEQALAQGNVQQAAHYLQEAAKAAQKAGDTQLGQELNQAAQALQQQAAGGNQQSGQTDNNGNANQVPNSGQYGPQSGLSSQDYDQMLLAGLDLLSKGDSRDGMWLTSAGAQGLSSLYSSYSATYPPA
jgi:ribosomal protein S20